MEWFSSILYCQMPPNSTSFAQNSRQSAQLFASLSLKSGMARHRWGLKSLFHTTASLIGHIWRTLNGSAASCIATCLQTASVLPKICGRVPNFLPVSAQKVAWPATDGDSGAGLTLHHHSLDPYGRHGKVQQHYILPHASKQYQFFLDVTAKLPNFFANPSTKSGMAWHRWGLRS